MISLVDLIVITYFRFNHNGETCFCRYDVPDGYEDACMLNIRFIIELFIGTLWVLVLVFVLAALVLACLFCREKRAERKKMAQNQRQRRDSLSDNEDCLIG